MGSSVASPPAILRRAVTGIAAAIVLASGIAFAIRGGSGTTTFIDYKREVITCTGTGGLEKYAYCNWQEPQTDAGSGSVITGIYYSIGKSPAVVGVDFTISHTATASGATPIPMMSEILTASGKTVVNLTGAILIGSGRYLRAVTLTNPTASHTASLMIEYYTRLSRP